MIGALGVAFTRKVRAMAGPLSLEAVLRDLARQKICCGILTTANDTVLVWLARNGQLVEGAEYTLPLRSKTPDQIARWLRKTANRLYGPLRTRPANRSIESNDN